MFYPQTVPEERMMWEDVTAKKKKKQKKKKKKKLISSSFVFICNQFLHTLMGSAIKKSATTEKDKNIPDVSYAGIVVGIILLLIGIIMFRSAGGDLNGIGVRGLIVGTLITSPVVYVVRILQIKFKPSLKIALKIYIATSLLLATSAIAVYSSGTAVIVSAVVAVVCAGILFKFYRDRTADRTEQDAESNPKEDKTAADLPPNYPTTLPPQGYPQPAFQGYPHPGNYYHNSPVMNNAMG